MDINLLALQQLFPIVAEVNWQLTGPADQRTASLCLPSLFMRVLMIDLRLSGGTSDIL